MLAQFAQEQKYIIVFAYGNDQISSKPVGFYRSYVRFNRLFELPVRVYLSFRARSVLLYDMKLNITLPLTEE